MPQIHFISFSGQRHSVRASEGESLMRAATDHGVPGIDGDCGGQCACGTCHVYVPAAWAPHLPAMQERERDMLEFTNERRDNSRLACQIILGPQLEGMEVHMPEGQH